MGQLQQGPPPYPSLPPNAYTPPCPIGYAPLPSYMPTAQSSHASSASGPSSDHGPSGFSSNSPPGPAPAPTGMMTGSADPSAAAPTTLGGGAPQPRPPGSEMGSEGVAEAGMGMGTLGHHPQVGAVSYVNQGGYAVPGQPGMVHPGFHLQATMMSQRAMMGMGVGGQGSLYAQHGLEKGGGGGGGPQPLPPGVYPPTMHPTAMDYVPGGGFIPRVGSPMPPAGTTVTELDQL